MNYRYEEVYSPRRQQTIIATMSMYIIQYVTLVSIYKKMSILQYYSSTHLGYSAADLRE